MLSKKREFLLSKRCFSKISLINALVLLKKYSIFKFNESIDLSINLSSDFIKMGKILKGSLNFPYNIYKFINILIFVDGYFEYLFRKMGYLNVGLFMLKIFFLKKKIDFKYFITTPKYYKYIYIFSDILSNMGINPLIINDENIEFFLINNDFFSYDFKSNKHGIINLSIGKVNYSLFFLEENFNYFLNYLKNKKKDLMIESLILKKIILSSTMGLSYNLLINNYFLF